MEEKLPIIGIGASAGGLEPLEELFGKMPVNTGFAFVVFQHLAPSHKSLMDELLSRHTKIPKKIISNGLEILPNHIYLNPPKEVVELVNSHFLLKEKTENRLSFPISTFFASLAENSQMMAACIILSGTGSDGAEGIKFIKEKGSPVLSQEPGKAIFNGMPNNAILTGSVDKVLQVADMADELIRFFKGAKALNESEDNFIKKKLVQILVQVKLHAGIDFTGYKFSTVQRRILRRLSITGIHTLDEYQTFITDSQTEARLLAKELLIGVTRFFRDKDAFEAIRKTVIPKIIEKNKQSREIRDWVPACSTC